jgi:hypothetical protein
MNYLSDLRMNELSIGPRFRLTQQQNRNFFSVRQHFVSDHSAVHDVDQSPRRLMWNWSEDQVYSPTECRLWTRPLGFYVN